MTPEDTLRLYTMACAATRTNPSETEADAWVWLLDDIDPQQAGLAMKNHLRSNKFMPVIAELVDEIKRLNGDVPPTVDEATGYYLSGRHDAHPFVAEAAAMAQWDYRHPDAAQQAKFDFRQNYAAVLHRHERAERDEQMAELTGGPIAALLAGESGD